MTAPILSKILLVEDNKNLGQTLSDYLVSIGHQTYWAKTAKEAIHYYNVENFISGEHIILMDLGLPDGDGIDLIKSFNKSSPKNKIIILSAQNGPDIRLDGLESGALDFILKPFNLKELKLRIERLSSNNSTDLSNNVITHGKLRIWFDKLQIQDGDGKILNLTNKESSILKLLYENESKALARDVILNHVWGTNEFPTNRTVDNYIVKLRKWMDSDPEQSMSITSIRGFGYKLEIKK